MKIDIRQHPTDRNKAEIVIHSQPVKVIDVDGQTALLEWEGMQWREKIPEYLGILPEDDQIKNVFIARVNESLSWIGDQTKQCPMCHKKFIHSDKGRKKIYCSDRCRMRASRERRR